MLNANQSAVELYGMKGYLPQLGDAYLSLARELEKLPSDTKLRSAGSKLPEVAKRGEHICASLALKSV